MVAPYETGNPIRAYVRVPGSGSDKEAEPLCWDLSRSSSLASAAPVPATIPSAIPITTLAKPSEDGRNNRNEQRVVAQPVSQTEETGHNRSAVAFRSVETTNEASNQNEGAVAQTTNQVPEAGQPEDDLPIKPGGRDEVPTTSGRKRKALVESELLDTRVSTGPPLSKRAHLCNSTGVDSTNTDPSTAMPSEDLVVKVEETTSEESKLRQQVTKLQQENQELRKQLKSTTELQKEKQELEERLKLFHDLFLNKKRLAMFIRRLGISVS